MLHVVYGSWHAEPMQSQLAAPPGQLVGVATQDRLGPVIMICSTQVSPAPHSLQSETARPVAAGVSEAAGLEGAGAAGWGCEEEEPQAASAARAHDRRRARMGRTYRAGSRRGTRADQALAR